MRRAAILCLVLTWLAPCVAWGEPILMQDEPPSEEAAKSSEDGSDATPETLLERANRLYDESRWAEARDAYLQHLKANPDDPGARSDLGVCYRELGGPKKALKEFDRVLAAHPEHWQALYNKIVVLGFHLDRKPEAVALLPELQKLRPDDEAVERLAAALGKK